MCRNAVKTLVNIIKHKKDDDSSMSTKLWTNGMMHDTMQEQGGMTKGIPHLQAS